MKVEFIKDHPVGIKAGEVKELKTNHANRLIDEGYCKEVKAKTVKKK